MDYIPAKTIISNYSETGWVGSNYNMNIYRGCCHGCIYCDSRSDCYHVENFDTVRAKENALRIIEKDLRSKRRKGLVMTGAMSDGYNPFEKQELLTRGSLKLIEQYGFGSIILTKSDLVLRDQDILMKINENYRAVVNFTITTADDQLCKRLERSVSVTSKRLAAMQQLSAAGIYCGVLLMPILPFINDTEENIRLIVERSAAAGARWIYAGGGFGVSLRQNQREHFLDWAERLYPGMRKKYTDTYGYAYYCNSPNNEALFKVFKAACKKHGLYYRMRDIAAAIRPEEKFTQMSLFDL